MITSEYTTLAKVKTYKDQGSGTASDELLLDMIRQASREMEDISNTWFYPQIATRFFDLPGRGNNDLWLDADLLEATSVVNGDGTTISASNYKTYPLNDYPKRKITLLPRTVWLPDSYGTPYGCVQVAGVWGYHESYPVAWEDIGASLQAAVVSTTATSLSVTGGKVSAGDLVKIDSEFLYASAVTTGNPDTVTVLRGVNGSAAATHLNEAAVLRWNPGQEIEMIARTAAVAYSKLRANPVGDTVNLDGLQFNTPKDVLKWMDVKLRRLGYVRTGIG